ncbi:efflux RND transporter periplasmic adaptor subunit [Clostridiaceae bacterium 35-E11]
MNKKIIFFVTAILCFTLFLAGCGKKNNVTAAKEEKLITVKTSKVEKKDLILKTTLSGKIKPVKESSIVSKNPGKVMKIHVEMGDKVQKGDILFELDTEDMSNSMKQAEAAYNVALANFNRTQEQIDLAKKNYARIKSLYEEGAVSQQQFEQAALQASETQLDVVKAQMEQSKVALDTAISRLADCTVTAPISGFITSVNINEGEMASSGMAALTIANLDTVLIETSISEHLINKVHAGDDVEVLVKSASATPLKGKIFALSPAPTENGLTYPMKVSLENKDASIKAGMFAEINIVSDRKENIITVPSDSVVLRDGNQVVFIVQNNIAKIHQVSLGLENGKAVEITKGVKEGDLIVVKGQNYLDEGNQVKIIE